MLSPRALEVVGGATPSRRVSLIVSVNPSAELERVSAIEDRKERLAKLLALYSRKKKPLLRHLCTYEKSGLRIVDPLVGTPDLLISAPARVWRRVLQDKPRLLKDPSLRFEANELDAIAC